MPRIDTRPTPAFEDGMSGNQPTLIQNANDIRQLMHFDDATGAIGNAVVVATDGDEAVVTDASLQLQESIEGRRGKLLQVGCSAAKASATIRCVVPCKRTLATVDSHSTSCALRSSRLRKERARKKSWRM
jgi:hypothetical protein